MTDQPGQAEPRDPRTETRGRLDKLVESRRTILFVGAAGTVSDNLIHALTREFPWVVIEWVEDVMSARRAFDRPVALLLVDGSLIRAVEQSSSELSRFHPQALIAAIQGDEANHTFMSPAILDSPSIRGVLPMNTRLDIWLSVIRLMLCGGEYFPPRMLHSYASRLRDTRRVRSDYGSAPVVGQGSEPQIADLTAREGQILEMVSRGLQNKTIAAEFRLSEHTVKIHIHNIITKLGAHNRTEAAAKFRHLKDRGGTLTGNGHWPAA